MGRGVGVGDVGVCVGEGIAVLDAGLGKRVRVAKGKIALGEGVSEGSDVAVLGDKRGETHADR